MRNGSRQSECREREREKMILRCSSKMANEVVLGELGWTLKGRRDFLILNYWGKIVGEMSPHRLVYHVYQTSRSRYDNSHKNKHSTHKWCSNVHSLLKSIGMEEIWKANTLTESEAKQWRSRIKERIREREETQWRENMQTKPKLRTYRQLKADDARQRSERSDDETERRDE